MEVILDELTPKEFFSNGGVVKIKIVLESLKKEYKRTKFLFYEYGEYLRFLREVHLKCLNIYHSLEREEIYKKIIESLEFSCSIGTKVYMIDPNFDNVHSIEFCKFYYCYDNELLPMKNDDGNKIDTYGIKNVNFSLINVDDTRWEKFRDQRLERGFDDSELWNLFETFSKFITPRLNEFEKGHISCPGNMTDEEWHKILNSMIEGFESIINGCTDDEKVEYGLKLFSKYFLYLWD